MKRIFGEISDPEKNNSPDSEEKTLLFEKGSQLIRDENQQCLIGVATDDGNEGGGDVASYKNLRVAFAGEMINFQTLCHEYGLDSQKVSSAELFARLFEKTKLKAPIHINGIFCAAVWDKQNRTITLFSDRTSGFYVFFYTVTNDSFVFGNSLPDVLDISGVKRDLDTQALYTFFVNGYVLPPHSLIKTVKKNWPGEAVVAQYQEGHGFHITREFVDIIPFAPETSGHTVRFNDFEDLLGEAIKDQMPENQETAFLLSGGIDSSSIVATASRQTKAPLNTFSAAFPGTSFDESPFALFVAKKYACNTNVIDMVNIQSMEQLPEIIYAHNEPTLDYSCLPTYSIFSYVKQHYSSVFGGDGPDHFFGRYYPVAAKQSVYYLKPLYQLMHAMTKKEAFQRLVWGGSNSLDKSYFGLFFFPTWGTKKTEQADVLFTGSVKKEAYPLDCLLPGDLNRRSTSYKEMFHRTVFMDTLVDGAFGVFKKIGSMSKLTNLTLRLPFFDRRLQDLIFKLPLRQRVHGNFLQALLDKAKSKYLLKYGMGKKILPPEVIRKNKGGFTPPLADWLKINLCSYSSKQILSPVIREADLFNLDFVDQILSEHQKGVGNRTTLLFMLLSFDLWYRFMIDEKRKPTSEDTYSKILFHQGIDLGIQG